MSADDVATTTATGDSGSVRPPDLPPDEVRGTDDVLAGWDADVEANDLARWQLDRAPFPTDTVVVAGAALAGALGGSLLDDRRGRGLARGLLTGLITAAVARRVWRLQP